MQHLHAMEGLQAVGNLFDDAAHGFEIGLRIVDHPLRQCLPFDEFGDDIEIVSLARWRARLQHVGIVDAPRDPFLHPEALQVGWIGAQVDRRRLNRDGVAVGGVDRQIDMAPAAGVDFADDLVAVDNGISRSNSGGARQVRRAA